MLSLAFFLACLSCSSFLFFLAHKMTTKKSTTTTTSTDQNTESYFNLLKTQELVSIIEKSALEQSEIWSDWGHYGTNPAVDRCDFCSLGLRLTPDLTIRFFPDGSLVQRSYHEDKIGDKAERKWIEFKINLSDEHKDRLKFVHNWIIVERLRVKMERKLESMENNKNGVA